MARHLWIRVKDPDTKHEFDIRDDHALLTSGRVTPVKSTRYPPAENPRPPKHHLSLAARRAAEKPAPAGEGTTTKKETQDG